MERRNSYSGTDLSRTHHPSEVIRISDRFVVIYILVIEGVSSAGLADVVVCAIDKYN
jgi:hypothetical protein